MLLVTITHLAERVDELELAQAAPAAVIGPPNTAAIAVLCAAQGLGGRDA